MNKEVIRLTGEVDEDGGFFDSTECYVIHQVPLNFAAGCTKITTAVIEGHVCEKCFGAGIPFGGREIRHG